jgi:hypothetical protein
VTRYARRWYSTLTFFTAFGITLGIVTIVRTGLERTQVAQAPRPAALAKPPTAEEPPVQLMQAAAVVQVSIAPPVIVEPPPATPARVQRLRDPFAAVLRRTPQDEALEEATRVYSMMEVALRDAVTVLPAAPASTSTRPPLIQSE